MKHVMIGVKSLSCLSARVVNSLIFLFLVQASQDKKSLDVGANLFVGNLDPVRSLNVI